MNKYSKLSLAAFAAINLLAINGISGMDKDKDKRKSGEKKPISIAISSDTEYCITSNLDGSATVWEIYVDENGKRQMRQKAVLDKEKQSPKSKKE